MPTAKGTRRTPSKPAKKTTAKTPAKKTTAKAPAAKKVAAKTTAKKAATKKITAKAPAKKTIAKAPAKKVAARKTTAKTPAKKVPVKKAPARKNAATKTAPKASPKGLRGLTLTGLDDVAGLARQLLDEADRKGRGVVTAGIAELAKVLGSLGRLDLADALLDMLPDDERLSARFDVALAAGHDIEPLWAPWLAAIEEEARENSWGESHEKRLANSFAQAIEGAREPARSQLVVRARARLERATPADAEAPVLDLLRWAGDLAGAQQLAERFWTDGRKGLFDADGPIVALVMDLLAQGQHEAGLAWLARLTPEAVVKVLEDSTTFSLPVAPAMRSRLDRILASLPAESAEEARGQLEQADNLATLIAGGTIEDGPYDMGYVEDLLKLGQHEAARHFMAARPASKGDPSRWALTRFQLGLDDFDTMLASLGSSESTMSNIDDWLDVIRLLLARDPRDERIDRVWKLVEKAMKKGPRTQYDRGVADEFLLRALALRADVAIARGDDVEPTLGRLRDSRLLRTDRTTSLGDTLGRWQRAGRPDEVEEIARKLPSRSRLSLALVAARGFLPDLGRALTSLVKIAGIERPHLPRRLASLLEASAAAQASITSTA